MFPYLLLIPVGTSLVLGVVYLFLGEARPLVKGAGVLVFVVAAYLQFFSSVPLAGVLLQTALAFVLAVWKSGSDVF